MKMFGKKAFTLIEVIISIAIFAAIALPLLSVFIQSFKVDRISNSVLNANYISQDYIEKLDTKTYSAALTNLPNRLHVGSYYLTAKIQPYGTANSLFTQQCCYVQLIMFSDSSMLCVMPDGKWHVFTSVPSTISLSVSSKVYTFTGGYTTLTGNAGYNYCALIINAMKMPNETASTITTNINCKTVLYCTDLNTNNMSITGDSTKYKNMVTGDTSLIFITTSVYNTANDENAIAVSDSYINIKNW